MTRIFLSTVAASVLTVVLLTFGAEGSERGAPGSDTRKAYCSNKQFDCQTTGFRKCDLKFGDDAEQNRACHTGVIGACKAAFGSESDCETAERVRPIDRTDAPTAPTVAPGESKPRKPPRDVPPTSPSGTQDTP